MPVLLDPTNFTLWSREIMEVVNPVAYGDHAFHFHDSLAAPEFRKSPHIDATTAHGTFEYEHSQLLAAAENLTVSLEGHHHQLTESGLMSYRENLQLYQTELNMFNRQFVDLFEFLHSRISPTLLLLLANQPKFQNAIQKKDPYLLFHNLSLTYNKFGVKSALNSLFNFFDLRPTVRCHSESVDQIDNNFIETVLFLEFKRRKAFITLGDSHLAAYLNSQNDTKDKANEEGFLLDR